MGAAERERARALLDAGRVLAVLDGLDEIGEGLRARAIVRINDALRPGQRLVVTARSEDYQRAVSPVSGPEVRLSGAAGVALCRLDAGTVGAYLRGSAGGPVGAARWDPVLAIWPATVAEALATPLMATLARTIYNPRPGEPAIAVGVSPTELLDPVRFPTGTAIGRHLFDGVIPAAYRPHPDPASRHHWVTVDTERWLVFLARHLEQTLQGSPDLAWWQLTHALHWERWLALRSPRRAVKWTATGAFGSPLLLVVALGVVLYPDSVSILSTVSWMGSWVA